jgi:hypothetical protein
MLAWEVTVKVYGVAVTMPQGYSRVPTPVDRRSVNVGTVHVASASTVQPGRMTADWHVACSRACAGRSRCSTRSRGKPGTGGRAAVCQTRRTLQCPKTRR